MPGVGDASGKLESLPPRARRALEQALEHILRIAQPRVVYMFGSFAEGRYDEYSDIDLLIVADSDDPGQLLEELNAAVGVHCDWENFDLLVLTPEQWAEESQLPGQLCFVVKRRGIVVYGQPDEEVGSSAHGHRQGAPSRCSGVPGN